MQFREMCIRDSYDIEVLKEVIADVFSEKSPEIVELNVKLSEFGYKYIKEKLKLSAYELEIVKPCLLYTSRCV